MKIGIDASRAFLKQRTGIEEYAYQTIKNLRNPLKDCEVVLYLHPLSRQPDFELPEKWRTKKIPYRRFWTQVGLSIEMLLWPVDVLFVPAHTIPFIHPKNTVVTVHGLEYEHNPESYSAYSLFFHKFFVRKSCQWAKIIIAVSKNTKKDVMKYYRATGKKIEVVYNGFGFAKLKIKGSKLKVNTDELGKYVLFVGRLENRKNIGRIAAAFSLLRTKYGYEGKLVLAGKPGYGYWDFEERVKQMDARHYIKELGYVSEGDKWQLIKKTDVFMFPSLSEGFGIPILEAQSVGTPVISSKKGPMDEVAGNEDVLINPKSTAQIAELANRLITDKIFRERVVEKGKANVKKFSWQKAGEEVGEILASLRNDK